MRFFASSLLSAALAAQASLATPLRSRSPYSVKETHIPPHGWEKLNRAAGDRYIQLEIALKQSNFAELERHLYEVSDPEHERYGQHLSADEVNELVKPTKKTSDLVHEWLYENGIEDLHYSAAKDWITIHVPVELAERLLDTEYHNYKHVDGNKVVARTTSWSLPRHLHNHIDAIQPTTSFFRAAANEETYFNAPAEVPESYKKPTDDVIARVCNVTSVTPECFANLYHTKGYKAKAGDKNTVGFNNFLGEVPIRPDAELFLKKYRPEAVESAKSFKAFSINGGPVQDGPLTANQSAEGTSKEANLDVQAIAGISWPVPIVSFSTAGEPPFNPDISTPDNSNEPYLVWVNWLLSQKKIPQVISTSYSDSEQTVPRSYADRVCKQFAQVGARGTTLFFSSGDRGVGGTDKCFSNDGKNSTRFLPGFPPTCPYVTAVGATMNFEPEESAYRAARTVNGTFRDLYASGAGFSNYFERPQWQKKVVDKYVKDLDGAYDGLYGKDGRAYPDLAGQGLYFAYFWNGTEGTISGTSASTPLVAGIFSLVNDALISQGKKPLGWLNPWLYSKGYKGLTDITKGFSYGCNVEGFPVTKGWDPVTGFGTPDFPKLVKLAGAKI
ncbi:subtilisin-like protein [Aaosphaeria arxii CBS 175.79]|uniref:tripeptidyl-peptidase II n=1 Tax=Aaosphaeria arxii CBS 175.79 TaxID=1450172 RepID=A0A6A5Y6E0_9PLEO|nr:subtilisin-like protein [Aaosphaeria arxii CBS 175.79]KAF2020370.1 subtilisin-like protein [Aaosphaeria arxii CBS 175.79]